MEQDRLHDVFWTPDDDVKSRRGPGAGSRHGRYVTEPDPLSGGKEERPIAPKDGCMNTIMKVKIVDGAL